ncbi:hypothetical protein [Bacillus mycoides]|uniref:hypothetical protein n=1 Tax=Bacillus mycoides TaxID=1405 RepID=UPI003D655B11
MNFKKDFIRVLNVNVLNLLIGIVTGFLLPACLPIDQYAHLKTFTLYLTYVGLLHFGYIDGLFLKYGGEQKKNINLGILKGENLFFLYFQVIITSILLFIGIYLNNYIYMGIALCILPMNIQSLFKFFYQAIGEFKVYSRITLLAPSITFIFNLCLIFYFKVDNFEFYILANIVCNYLIFIILELIFLRNQKYIKVIYNKGGLMDNFRIGIFVMIGNFSSILFYTVDRWFVKYYMDVRSFAFYSFAISMMTVITVMIGAVTTTLYPYLARNKQLIKNSIRVQLLILGTLLSSSYFVFALIVESFMVKYIESLSVISILFVSFPAIIVINALYSNLYKLQRKQKRYFVTIFCILIFNVLMNLVAIHIYAGIESIAIATSIAFYVWYIYSGREFKSMKSSRRESLFLILYLMLFLWCSLSMTAVLGGIIYLVGISILILICFFSEIQKAIFFSKRIKG